MSELHEVVERLHNRSGPDRFGWTGGPDLTASETNFKDPQRLFPGFLCGVRYQPCWSDRYKTTRTLSSRSRRVYSSIHISRASAPNCSRVESQRVSAFS